MEKEITLALLTVNKLGAMDKRNTKKIAMWLRKTADQVENNSREYSSTGPVRFRNCTTVKTQ